MFYDMYVGEVGMADCCSYVDNLVTLFLIYFNLFEVCTSSQDVCHKLVVSIFTRILLFMSWYGRVLMVKDEVKVIASFASISTFSFPGIPICEGTHMNLIALWVKVLMLWICNIISLERFGASMARRALRESLIIQILFVNIDFPSINASLIA